MIKLHLGLTILIWGKWLGLYCHIRCGLGQLYYLKLLHSFRILI